MTFLFVLMVLLARLVSQSTAQFNFYPDFPVSQFTTNEGVYQAVYLSAPFLSRLQTPAFKGSIEVDISAEDLPSDDSRQKADFGTDYIVNIHNPSSRIFTVVFKSKKANSTEHLIVLGDDQRFEGSESLRLRIVAVRFNGQAAVLFRAQAGVVNTSVDVTIKDDDYVEVHWTTSGTIPVTEGDGVEVRLSGQAIGLYANPIAIGVICTDGIVTGIEPSAFPDRDFNFTAGTKLHFIDLDTSRSFSNNQVVPIIINDDIAEPCKFFTCTLQGGFLHAVCGITPNQVTIEICDDDPLIVRWATDVYIFREGQLATVELVTDSNFEVDEVSIQGFPKQIPDGDQDRFSTLVLPGPNFSGFAFDATIERAVIRADPAPIFGNAQVNSFGRTDVVFTTADFVFTPTSKSSKRNFTIVDDDVLEFDELFIVEFTFSPEISNKWYAIKENPSIAYIIIRDDDYVEVNFKEKWYTVTESDGQVSVSLSISGKFFVPVFAIVEVSSMTAKYPEDFFGAVRYNVTFNQTAFTDRDDPTPTAMSSNVIISIVDDDIFEGVEYFQARIVQTSDEFRVQKGPQNTVEVIIVDDDICT